MPDLTLDFTWYRDPKGYRLIPARIPDSITDDVRMSAIQPGRIVRKGGKLQSYRPLDHFPALFDRFINTATTENGVLEFVEKFGPLTEEGLRGKGDVVDEIVEQAEAMARPGSRTLNRFSASVIVGQDEMRLKVSPICLLDALWLQLAQANTRSRECPQCRKPFRIGVAVRRRKDARFCSDDCRIKFNSLERSR
jgi:hypothetical protein